jgi:hypothetical protein
MNHLLYIAFTHEQFIPKVEQLKFLKGLFKLFVHLCDLRFLQIGTNNLRHLEKQMYQQKIHKVKQPNMGNETFLNMEHGQNTTPNSYNN